MSYASKIKVKNLTSGATALTIAFPAHERVSIVGSIAGGARLAGSRALAEVHAAMLLEGTKRRDKSAIQITLDDLGASLSFFVEKDRLVFDAHVRVVYAKKLLALISEVLREPLFPEREFTRLKERMTAELSLEAQETRSQAAINLSRLLYPEGHPNRQKTTTETLAELQKLTRKDIAEYHARAIDRSSLIVSIAGDIEKDAAFELVENSFAKLPKLDITLSTVAPVISTQSERSSVRIEDKASIDYMMGIATGITKDNPDFPALLLGVQALGNRSGFTGRLMQTVREIDGLTYGAYSFLAGFQNADGYITVWATFAPELLEKGKTALMHEIKKIVEEGATDTEIKKHRTMYEARSRVTLSNSADLARAAHDTVVEGHKPSYLDEFPQTILKLTATQVNKALKKYLVIDKLSESAAGPLDVQK